MINFRPRPLPRILALLAAMAMGHAIGAAPPSPNAAGAAAPETTDRIIVRYRDKAASRMSAGAAIIAGEHVHASANRRGLMAKQLHSTGLGAQIWSLNRPVSHADAQVLAQAIAAADPNVEYAEPDRQVRLAMTPNDPRYFEQWNLQQGPAGIGAQWAWDFAKGAGVVVAVIDTGYRPHADLAPNLLPGYDFITSAANLDGDGRDADAQDPGSTCADSVWHGTHVAGTIAAVTNNGVGVAGVAHGAKVVPIRAIGVCSGYESDITDGILWASGNPVPGVPPNPNPARVINLSLSNNGQCSQTWINAIAAAKKKGAVIIAAAGNFGIDVSLNYPANCPGVIRVVATDNYGRATQTTNKDFGYTAASQLTLAAPGANILSTSNTGTVTPLADTYAPATGTSMAAPHVAGVAAIVLSIKPTLSSLSVEQILRKSVKSFPVPELCNGCGAGITDASYAIQNAYTWPTVAPASITKSRVGTGTVTATATASAGGPGPFTYAWSKTGNFDIANTSSATVTVSQYMEVCGAMAEVSEGELRVRVTDQDGRVMDAAAPVRLTFTRSTSSSICR